MSRERGRVVRSRLHPIDYDLHGIVGIRLLDATADDARAVARQLGPLNDTLHREPDIVIRFVDDLCLPSPLCVLGASESGFTHDAFLVLQGGQRSKERVRLPLERIGGRCEIICESGLPAVPLLVATINMTALAKGFAPLHASAFLYRGSGVLVTGWSKGGKTEALLAFASRGAEYVGDEWVYLDPDSSRMYGIPQPIRVWDWHLDQCATYHERIGWQSRLRLRAIRAALAIGRTVAGNRRTGTVLDRMQALMSRQAFVDVAPERLFGSSGRFQGPLDRVFFVESTDSQDVVVKPVDPSAMVRRMVHSVSYECRPLVSHYLMFKFAFPEASNRIIERLETHLGAALHRALDAKPTYSVQHPYPMVIGSLFEAMDPLI